MIRLSKSIVGNREADAVARVLLKDGYLGMGKEVQAFEQEIAAFLGVSASSVAVVNSGTAAVHLATEATVDPGSEVLVQSLTFVASFQGIRAAGAIPVACEVDAASISLDVADAERRITPLTRAVMPVHYASDPSHRGDVQAFARANGLRVIEDAAHAFGCRDADGRIGSSGDVFCFSFDGIKNITSGEGGAVVSGDAAVMQRVRDARLLGVERDTERRYDGQRSWEFECSRQGYRYHLSNVLAAIGRVQLARFEPEFAPARIRLAQRYRARLSGVTGISLLSGEPGPDLIPHIMALRVLGGRRDHIRSVLAEQGIETGVHYKPNHLLSYFQHDHAAAFPVTEALYEELLSLPLHPDVTDDNVDTVCDALINALPR